LLKEINILNVYDSEYYNIIKDLQIPLLSKSVDYLRGVGFFTSGWLTIAAAGIVELINNGGRARIVLSPILSESDWEAFVIGEKAKEDRILYELLSRNIYDIQSSMEIDVLNTLSWMIADGIIEFRFAISREKVQGSDYHDKAGVFTDINGDYVAIHGSFNDSIKASMNGEAFSVFKSWEFGQCDYALNHKERLENLWNNNNKQFKVYQTPDIIREKLIKLKTTNERPYNYIEKENRIKQILPNINLYPYQQEAINKWMGASCCGIFEMATGTGKTITSLAAANSLYHRLESLIIIIIVPFVHLLDQWEKNCRQFGFEPILCSGEHTHWAINIKSAIADFKIKVKKLVCIISVHKTAASDSFQNSIKNIPGKKTLLIGDEVHGLGSGNMKKALNPIIQNRLGLSATPRRWFDDEGSGILFNYFGKICFEFTLEQAIGKYLTPYEYNPQLIQLLPEELEEYDELSDKIKRLTHKRTSESEEVFKRLLFKRAHLLSSAKNKVLLLINLLNNLIDEFEKRGETPCGILIYCAPGEHKEILKKVSKTGLRCHEFVHNVSLLEREKILSQFENGLIQVLIAIKCLDEGVDVPATQYAFILSSSTNPKEFVQRRGRILRLSKNKTKAFIYDFIVAPDHQRIQTESESYIGILKREMPRFVEFSSSATNEFAARSKIRDILDYYQMLNLLDEKPWDVYHRLKESDWSVDYDY